MIKSTKENVTLCLSLFETKLKVPVAEFTELVWHSGNGKKQRRELLTEELLGE